MWWYTQEIEHVKQPKDIGARGAHRYLRMCEGYGTCMWNAYHRGSSVTVSYEIEDHIALRDSILSRRLRADYMQGANCVCELTEVGSPMELVR